MKNKLVYIVLFVGFCVNMFACSDGKGEALLPEPIPNPTPVPKYTLPTGKLIYIPDELQSNDFTKEESQWSYDVNVNKLKFVETGKSNTDKYRMMIFLKYQSEWLATGSGYDDIIGALWVNPSTCPTSCDTTISSNLPASSSGNSSSLSPVCAIYHWHNISKTD